MDGILITDCKSNTNEMKPSLKNLTSKNYSKPRKNENDLLQNFGRPHIDSFNFFLEDGLKYAVKNLQPIEFMTQNKTKIKLAIQDVVIHPPRVADTMVGVKTREMYPTECRQRKSSYGGKMEMTLVWYENGTANPPITKDLGKIPIMLKSKKCNLHSMGPKQLVSKNEHESEWGGYFVVRGSERMIRLLLNTRRNYPIAMKRSSWKKRDNSFSDLGVSIRCVSFDHTSQENTLHFLTDGTAKLMMRYRRSLYYAPIMLIVKCLVDYTDEFFFKHMLGAYASDLYYKSSLIEMLRILHESGIHTSRQARNYLGKMFRVKLKEVAPWATHEEVCDFLLKNCVFIHLNDNFDKFKLASLMLQKLFQCAQKKCLVENADAIMLQELLLGGHLYLQIIKEKLYNTLTNIKFELLKLDNPNFTVTQGEITKVLKKHQNLGRSLETFISTGNLFTTSGLGMMQDKGLTILVENISRTRYMANFRAVHRGSVFEQMRITEPRQLLPDAWGFICPVHTPDGTPCGLLNHLSRKCVVTTNVHPKMLVSLCEKLVCIGMVPVSFAPLAEELIDSYVVMLDGRIIGYTPDKIVNLFVYKLRAMKIKGQSVPSTLEIVVLKKPTTAVANQFAGIYLFTENARMMRPVLNLAFNQVELIGTFEQVYLDICLSADQIIPGVSSHQELSTSDFLSPTASLIPMPDYNQSPRNMYQCQMSKQTMGTAVHNWLQQSQTKLYRLQTPASPLFRPAFYDLLDMDDFAMGINAIIAVISYTGYDMEDAMVINKASLDRGFAHGYIYKTDVVELKAQCYFELDPNRPEEASYLCADGLPNIGSKISTGQYYYCYLDGDTKVYRFVKYSGREEVIVDSIKRCEEYSALNSVQKALITLRIQRNPSVGDKFASRAGQKGIFSNAFKMEDLPFTESGLVPDIVFNPHGFPSRMTIAMMIECMAGKAAALNGTVYDASPFQYSENDTAINYFGTLLQEAGYNYFGTERMYSGVYGTEMPCSIFFGIVHYQRLRHMVSDKWQVRSTGIVDIVTKQPIKGRKRGGGGRVGEMERDSLISHGAAALLQDRLVECSDRTTARICARCRTLISATSIVAGNDKACSTERRMVCLLCRKSDRIFEIGVPHIFKYLMAELASVNITLRMDCE